MMLETVVQVNLIFGLTIVQEAKKNKEDARDEMKLRFGRRYEIIDIYLFEEGRV